MEQIHYLPVKRRKLADHILFIANIDYGYSVTDVKCMAADYARSLGKNVRAKGSKVRTGSMGTCSVRPNLKTVPMVGGNHALGNHAPPFYIFPGKRWQDCFIEGAVAGSVGKMSDSGWINRGIFEEYVTSQLVRYAALNVNLDDNPVTLVL
ncbi:hypothetical protein DPMN_151865 [Dreissena polymorpha]|uniref:Uncharacterized protein n=1 Tax=Dreissena polymorpha TaxID=45954 RepID=A0A9D4FJB8_DREPO|nr:hypothetical protein DPMN_151865 [Dreissena polymorpha]